MEMDKATMLTLAAIAYRGFNLALMPEVLKRDLMRAAMRESLKTLSPVRDQWEIVWGPASFSTVQIGVDDSAMYVVQNRQDPSTFVISVRGTNPISPFDWVFGDLLVRHTVAWPYGDRANGASISLSTALGLYILQHLHSEPASGCGTGMSEAIGELFDQLKGTADWLIGVSETIRPRPLVTAMKQAIAEDPGAKVKPFSLKEWLDAIRQRQLSQHRDPVIQQLELQTDGIFSARLNTVGEVMAAVEHHVGSSAGIDLRTFLGQTVRGSSGPLNIFVTGHSKGGALAPTLALWLADTQGEVVSREEQWDPEKRAVVYCYSFAGPTAGNAEFAKHSDATIGPRCWRIANNNDIVPHAWADVSHIATLYGSSAEELVLKPVCEEIAESVGDKYRQIGGHVDEFDGRISEVESFIAQAVHQHMDAYLEHAGLPPDITAATFLTPVV